MKGIDVDDLKKGDVVEDHILFDDNFIVLTKFHTLTESDIERVRRYKLLSLYTLGDNRRRIEPREQKREAKPLPKEATYDILITYIQTTFSACRQKKKVPLQVIHNAASLVVNYTLTKREEALLRVARGMKQGRFAAHSLNTAILSAILGDAVNIKETELVDIVAGALFHDIGLVFLGRNNVKPNIRDHTLIGFKYLKTIEGIKPNITIPSLQHHERANGSGYPAGLTLSGITHSSRIVSICDSCDSQISLIRNGNDISLHMTKEDLFSWKKEDFDARLFRVFTSAIGETFAEKRRVLLSDMTVGVVKKISARFPFSPVVDIIADSKGERPREPKVIEIVKNNEIWIERFLQGQG
ncbi:MAG TPA: HD domain-containing protein [Spirochaetota bacterium]|nr:HD domain-containing protein [Spirochaetota bacterium]